MKYAIALALIAALFGCSSTPSEPDATAKLIAQRYSDCVPGLKAEDVKKISDRRYTWSDPDGKWVLAWTIGAKNNETGEPFTPPTDDSLSQFEKLGCV